MRGRAGVPSHAQALSPRGVDRCSGHPVLSQHFPHRVGRTRPVRCPSRTTPTRPPPPRRSGCSRRRVRPDSRARRAPPEPRHLLGTKAAGPMLGSRCSLGCPVRSESGPTPSARPFGPCCSRTLAGVTAPAGDKARRERLCRYVTRPAFASEQVERLADARVRFEPRGPCVFVNGERVCRAVLSEGDLISLGQEVVLELVRGQPNRDGGGGMPPPSGTDPSGSCPAEAFVVLPKH